MWADVLTKLLQGAKFRLMGAFLMNCPLDYYEDPVLTPTDTPTTNPTVPSPKISHKSRLPFVPTDKPTDILMKPQSLRPTPSSWGCVETKSHGTKVPSPSRTYEYAPKHVRWRATSPAEFSYSPCTAR